MYKYNELPIVRRNCSTDVWCLALNSRLIRLLVLALLAFVSLMHVAPAQDVSIPDPGLNAAIRDALQKPTGPLTQQDLLGLTNLSAISWNITNLQGLAAAHNLSTLFLDDNQLTDLSFPEGLTNLTSLSFLVLNGNPLTSRHHRFVPKSDAGAQVVPNKNILFQLTTDVSITFFVQLNGVNVAM